MPLQRGEQPFRLPVRRRLAAERATVVEALALRVQSSEFIRAKQQQSRPRPRRAAPRPRRCAHGLPRQRVLEQPGRCRRRLRQHEFSGRPPALRVRQHLRHQWAERLCGGLLPQTPWWRSRRRCSPTIEGWPPRCRCRGDGGTVSSAGPAVCVSGGLDGRPPRRSSVEERGERAGRRGSRAGCLRGLRELVVGVQTCAASHAREQAKPPQGSPVTLPRQSLLTRPALMTDALAVDAVDELQPQTRHQTCTPRPAA